MVSGVSLKVKENYLVHIQDSGSSHKDFNSIISFHKVKSLVSSRALEKPGAMHKCKCWVSVKVLSPQQRILRSFLMSSQISFCAAAMNSSCWASHATNFTCTLSDTVEVLWRVWKHIFTYGVKVLCGNIAPSHLLWNVLSPVFAQKVLVSTSARMLEIQHIWLWFTSPCSECF